MARRASGRLALVFILVTVLLDTVGFGILIPVLPELIMELTGEGIGKAAVYGGWLTFVYALMQFLCGPLIGNLSDRYGRRPVLLLTLFMFGLDYLLMGLAPSLGWLFAGRLLAGVVGATYSAASAYVADVSRPEERAQSFGLLGASWALGFILGPVIGGLLGDFGPRAPFFAAAGLALVNVTLGAFALPESLPPEQRRPFSWKRANPAGALLQMRQYPAVFGLLGVLLLYQLAHDSLPSVWSFYTMLKFDWTERDIGYSMGAIGLLLVIIQGSLIRVAIPRLGETRAVVVGMAMMAAGFAGFALATRGWMMYVFIVPLALSGLATPALRSILSNQVPANGQGELQGAITSVASLMAIVSPLLMTNLFGYFTSESAPVYFPGAPYLAAALLVTAGALLFLRASRVSSWMRAERPPEVMPPA